MTAIDEVSHSIGRIEATLAIMESSRADARNDLLERMAKHDKNDEARHQEVIALMQQQNLRIEPLEKEKSERDITVRNAKWAVRVALILAGIPWIKTVFAWTVDR